MARSPHTALGRLGVATLIGAAILLPASVAAAAVYPSGGTPGAVDIGSAEVKTKTVTNPSAGTLPFTGGDVAGLTAIGAGCALAGVVLVRRSRRHAAA